MVKERAPLENSSRCSFSSVNQNKTKAKPVQTKNIFKARLDFLKRVQEIQANIGSEFPSFLKSLTKTQVAGKSMKCYVPTSFSRKHFLGNDETVTLTTESECEIEHKVTYIQKNSELCSGWKRFSTVNNLCLGDNLVFQLIGHFKLKVYIVRIGADTRNGHEHTSGSGTHLSVYPRNGANKSNDLSQNQPSATRPCKSLPRHIPEGNIKQKSVHPRVCKHFIMLTKEGVLSSRFPPKFEKVRSIYDFLIVINGLHIGKQLVSTKVRTKYFELCRSQKSYLHDYILKHVNNSNWAASIISKIVNIADAARSCAYSTPVTEYNTWSRLLYSFEVLGMNVGFIRARLNRLMRLSGDDKIGYNALRTMRVGEARRELLDTEEKIDTLEIRLSKLKRKKEELTARMEGERKILHERKRAFQVEVNAPW